MVGEFKNQNLTEENVKPARKHPNKSLDFNKKQSRWLTRGAGDAIEPCWTQDGRHLVYTARTKKSRRLILIDTETGKMQRLSPDNLGNVFQAAYVSSR